MWSAPGTLKTFYLLLSCFREKYVLVPQASTSTGAWGVCLCISRIRQSETKNLSTPFPQTARHDRRPKVRKAAMAATVELLRLHAGKRVWVLGRQVADFSNNVLAACTASDCLPTLHLLGFLQEVRFVDGCVVCPSIST